MALIATLLSDRARREGSAYIGRADLDLVDTLELGQVVIIKETSTGDRILGWVADVLGADLETVYKIALGPVLSTGKPGVPIQRGTRYRLQDVQAMLDRARELDLPVPRPREPKDGPRDRPRDG